ncbi:hypothetical protein M0R88_02235 [Halorussus gelatinilyticus]|uniref:DUF6199 domain-containing protein n=1 Tax=Halorussus gelatinilyticus TaxID=2937524 RepID=A0A8U0IKT6_9EURY|nr:hypothetical protein [Halorussus gelatinilyticus]UPW00932.1 hypothetical protein M0R88_02235 [Halorussus gelatinilyticus]
MFAPFAEPLGYPAAVVVFAIGYAFVRYPRAMYWIRNFSGFEPEPDLGAAGTGLYRVTGYLLVVMGFIVLGLTLIGGLPSR